LASDSFLLALFEFGVLIFKVKTDESFIGCPVLPHNEGILVVSLLNALCGDWLDFLKGENPMI
jgi:hypothetical protein